MSYWYRQALMKRDFDESQVNRGKTVEGTNAGSFAPKGSMETVGSELAENRYSSFVGHRNLFDINKSLDDEVRKSYTPSQTLKAQFGEFPTEEETLAIVKGAVTAEEWERFVDASDAMGVRLKETGDSETAYSQLVDGKRVYDEEREALVHAPVLQKYLDMYESRVLPAGEMPEMVVLAGRGGSGKSAFGVDPETGQATNWNFGYYDKSYVVIDPDEIKKDVAAAARAAGKYSTDDTWNPERDGSSYWHEESSYVSKRVVQAMLDRASAGAKANMVLDLTLNSDKTKDIAPWKKEGYHVSMANINVPVATSATNALKRYLQGNQGRGGRLVPLTIIANSKTNEANFDTMIRGLVDGRPLVDSWSVYTAGRNRHRLVASGGLARPRGNT